MASTPTPTTKRLHGHVLLVEDNPINQMVAKEMLIDFGLTVDSAANGAEALTALSQNSYDLVLMDCQMPVLDGFAATVAWREQESREARQRTPISAITANALPTDRQRCLDCGMDDYLAKPYRREELLGMLMKWLPSPANSSK